MTKYNGETQVEIDEVGEMPRIKPGLMRAACDNFLIGRGLKAFEFNRQYGRKKKKKAQ